MGVRLNLFVIHQYTCKKRLSFFSRGIMNLKGSRGKFSMKKSLDTNLSAEQKESQ